MSGLSFISWIVMTLKQNSEDTEKAKRPVCVVSVIRETSDVRVGPFLAPILTGLSCAFSVSMFFLSFQHDT